jgi:hypothetical protein
VLCVFRGDPGGSVDRTRISWDGTAKYAKYAKATARRLSFAYFAYFAVLNRRACYLNRFSVPVDVLASVQGPDFLDPIFLPFSCATTFAGGFTEEDAAPNFDFHARGHDLPSRSQIGNYPMDST